MVKEVEECRLFGGEEGERELRKGADALIAPLASLAETCGCSAGAGGGAS